jgi:glucokinase
MQSEYTIGLDLGGTNLRAAAIDKDGKLLDNVSGRTKYSQGRQPILDDMVAAIASLRLKHGVETLKGIGVAVPGFILLEQGLITNSNNLASLENFPIRDELSRHLGTHVILENDANAAALGEKWIGAGHDVNDLVLVTLGTGIGGGIISNGTILRGQLGMAGELGHITVVPNGNPCGCGNRGCVEKHASATAITACAKLLGLGDAMSASDVYELALTGNAKANSIFVAMGEALGILMAMLVNTFNFPLYLLSGGPISAWDLFAPVMLAETRLRSFTYRTTDTRIEKSHLGSEAGLFGAAYLPWILPPTPDVK